MVIAKTTPNTLTTDAWKDANLGPILRYLLEPKQSD